MPDEPLWDLAPHTFVKHQILRRYLGAWFGKLGHSVGRVVFIDGFAGPGTYAGGEPGSPIVALDVALGHEALTRCTFEFLFCEEDERRAAILREQIAQRILPSNVSCEVFTGSFAEEIRRRLDAADRIRDTSPRFIMIDPFGWTGFPHSLVKRIGDRQYSEVFISLMYEGLNRFLRRDGQEANMDALFGTPVWRDAIHLDSQQRQEFLLGLYRSQLKRAGFRYTYAFELRDSQNKPEYFLVHGTKNIVGLDAMKQAMWAADPSGRFRFSDYESARLRGQLVLFDASFDPTDVQARIEEYLAERPGEWIDVNVQLLEWLVTQTPYHSSQFKRDALGHLEKRGRVEVRRPAGHHRSSYWNDGTSVRAKPPA